MLDDQQSFRSAWTSTWVALASMLLYAISNTILRYLGDEGAPINWMLGMKESTCVLLVLPWVLYRFFQGRYRYQSKRLFLVLIFGGLVCQVIGARNQLWAFATVGLVITIPVIQSSQLIASAVVGRIILKDRVSKTKMVAIALLILSVCLFAVAKTEPSSGNSAGTKEMIVLFGVLSAALAGLAYAVHMTGIRYSMQKHWSPKYGTWQTIRVHDWIGHDFSAFRGPASQASAETTEVMFRNRTYSPFPITMVMLIVTLVGAVYFISCGIVEKGVDGFFRMPTYCYGLILLSGLMNSIGFFFQIQGLLLASVAKMSLISASNIVILTIFGVFLFHEPLNGLIILGSLLAISGVILSSQEAE